MSLFAPQKMSLNESKNWTSKSRRLKDSCLANTLMRTPYIQQHKSFPIFA